MAKVDLSKADVHCPVCRSTNVRIATDQDVLPRCNKCGNTWDPTVVRCYWCGSIDVTLLPEGAYVQCWRCWRVTDLAMVVLARPQINGKGGPWWKT